VKAIAEDVGLPVLQPDRPRGDEFMESLRALKPDLSVVAAYGHILQAEVLDLPPLSSFNVHASLLPELRGAAPVNWAIIRGHRESGVTIMKMVQAMDAGPVILKSRCELSSDITAGALTEQLAELGAEALLEALKLIEAGQGEGEPQDEDAATYAPKLTADDARLDWTLPAAELDRWIRGTDPVPGAWTQVGGLRVRVFAPRVVATTATESDPGVVVTADPRVGLHVATGAGTLDIGEVQPAGKRRMDAAGWIRGRGIEPGQRFA
jgi:methionyl-tRNA formyltransferase